MHNRAQVEELKELAHRRMGDVLAGLGVTARPNRKGLILISNPRMKDVTPSFAIWTHGGTLAWKYFSGGDKGDVVDLVSYLNGWWELPDRGFVEAARWLEDRLGVKTLSQAQRTADLAKARAAAERADKAAAEELERGIRWARALFLNAAPVWGTVAEAYIREARGLDFDLLPCGPRGGKRTPGALRFLAAHRHTDPKTGAETGRWPCIVVPFTDMFGTVMGVHRTWLAPDGSGKADVPAPRKAFPDVAGLVLPLWRGDSRLSVREANACGLRESVMLTEGWEDGYSAVLGDPRHRTWGAYSLGNLANIAASLPECIDAVLIHRQNDWNTPQAVAQFEVAKAAIEATGRPVAEVAAFVGKDLNDTLRAAK